MSYEEEINTLGRKLGLDEYQVIVEDGELLLIHRDYTSDGKSENLVKGLEYGHKFDIWDILHAINDHKNSND
jgi:hypothetical protein